MDNMEEITTIEEELIPVEENDICTVDTEDFESGIDLKSAAIGTIVTVVGIGIGKGVKKYVVPKVKAGWSKLKAWKHNRDLVAAKKEEDAIEAVEADFEEVEEK